MTTVCHEVRKIRRGAYYIGACLCGWQINVSTKTDRARGIQRHLAEGAVATVKEPEMARTCPKHGAYPAGPGFCCPDIR